MARHYPQAIMCRNLAGKTAGRVCANCDGRCILCDSHGNLNTKALICDECTYGAAFGKCLICQSTATTDARYCDDCVELELDRDGCPKIVNIGTQRAHKHFDKRQFTKQ
eukprot:UN04147